MRAERPVVDNIRAVFQELRDLTASSEDIISDSNCWGCNSPTEARDVDYEYDWRIGEGFRLTITKRLPGSVCLSEVCGVNYQQSGLHDRFLNAVALGMSRLGDDSLSESLVRRMQDPREYTSFTPSIPFAH